MEGITFKHLRITRATSGFSFAWQQSEVTEPLAAAVPDLKKGIELLLVAPKDPLLTKTLIEFTLWAERITGITRRSARTLPSEGEVRRSRKFTRGCASLMNAAASARLALGIAKMMG